MRFLAVFFICAFLGQALADGAIPERETDVPPARFNVGYRVVDFRYVQDGREQMLAVAVWYPTAAQPHPHLYGGTTGGNVAPDAAPYAGDSGYPLLVFSHGYGGGGISSVFFTEALAARGWIVACPDHHDRHSAVRIRTGQSQGFDGPGLLRHAAEIAASTPANRHKYLYRLDEMRATLDGMLASPVFGASIDRQRIAVGGHSFGGFTALGLSGPLAAYRDERIKALLLFSTGAGGYLFSDDELTAVRVPSMLFMGEKERTQQRGNATMAELSDRIYRNVAAPKYFLEIGGANHFSFNNRFADNRRTRRMSGSEEQFDTIRQYALAFLDRHVAGNRHASAILERTDPRLTRMRRAPGEVTH